MKKSLYAVIVVLLSSVGLNALASMVDVQINKVVTEAQDKGSNENQGNKACGPKATK